MSDYIKLNLYTDMNPKEHKDSPIKMWICVFLFALMLAGLGVLGAWAWATEMGLN